MSSRSDRQREIAQILSRHGMGYLVGILGLERWVPFHRGLLGHEPRNDPYTRPEHVRLALEQLGATFVKLGQILSTRADLLPPEYRVELAKLQDAGPPVAPELVRDLVAHELDREADAAFATFDFNPIAAASIGQAHAATLPDGTEVVVKVRRPGVVEQVGQDLEIIQNLAARADRRWEVAADYDLAGLADEFAQTLRSELDYLTEGRNAEQFAANFSGDPDVHIPQVLWDTTTTRVLTLERIRGIKITDLEALDAAGIDRRALAERATRVTAQMVFEHGFFHADPHPGNFLVESDGRIGLIDFGMVGSVDDRLRERLGWLLLALSRQDPDGVADALLELGAAHSPVDRRQLRDDIAGVLQRYSGRALGELALAAVVDDVLAIVRRHRLRLPRELALLLKMVVMNEGMAAQLDPQFQLGHVLAPFAQELMARQLAPAALARRLGEAGIDAAQLAVDLPAQLRALLATLDRGGVEVHLRAQELEHLVVRIERSGNRLLAGVIAGAFMEAMAEVMTADPERWHGRKRPLLAVGIGAAGSLGAYLAWTARRGRRT